MENLQKVLVRAMVLFASNCSVGNSIFVRLQCLQFQWRSYDHSLIKIALMHTPQIELMKQLNALAPIKKESVILYFLFFLKKSPIFECDSVKIWSFDLKSK